MMNDELVRAGIALLENSEGFAERREGNPRRHGRQPRGPQSLRHRLNLIGREEDVREAWDFIHDQRARQGVNVDDE